MLTSATASLKLQLLLFRYFLLVDLTRPIQVSVCVEVALFQRPPPTPACRLFVFFYCDLFECGFEATGTIS